LIRDDLESYFDPIYAIKIPHSSQSSQSSPLKALDQLESLGALLRQENWNACARRPQFSLSFSLDDLTMQIGRALEIFSGDVEKSPLDETKQPGRTPHVSSEIADGPSFDWNKETMGCWPKPSSWSDCIKAFWTRCLQQCQLSSPRASFRLALKHFSARVVFCVQLHMHRFPLIDHKVGKLSDDMDKSILEIQRYVEDFAPCEAIGANGTACGGTRRRHNINRHESPSARWVGTFETTINVNLVRDIEADESAKAHGHQLTAFPPPDLAFMRRMHCIATCLGCLLLPPSVLLACGHTFCETCVKEIVGQHPSREIHELDSIICAFCSYEMAFSPRLLPDRAGYRILSLDGGGVRGIAQICLLAAIEQQCFGIPIAHLFDFIIGTSIGGHIALALASKDPPSTVEDLKLEFFELMNESIKRRFPLELNVVDAALLVLFELTSHKNDPMEKSLKHFFGPDRLVLAANNPPGPHVAVTTVSMDDLGTALLIPN
jgi:hypothetical protein